MVCPSPRPDWHWSSSQASFLSRSHRAELVVILDLLLIWTALVVPHRGDLSQANSHPQSLVGSSSLQLTPHPESLSGAEWNWTGGHLGLTFSGTVKLLIIQMFGDLTTEHRNSLSPLCHLLTGTRVSQQPHLLHL